MKTQQLLEARERKGRMGGWHKGFAVKVTHSGRKDSPRPRAF